MKIITFKTDKSGITIRIPRTLLNHVAKSHPEFPVKIKDSQRFMQEVCEQIKENNFNSSESGLTGFEELIDLAIETVVDSGSESCESIELED